MRATEKLQKIDNSGRQAILMSSHINSLSTIRDKGENQQIIEKPFGCSYCEKRFDNSKELSEHLNIHPQAISKGQS